MSEIEIRFPCFHFPGQIKRRCTACFLSLSAFILAYFSPCVCVVKCCIAFATLSVTQSSKNSQEQMPAWIWYVQQSYFSIFRPHTNIWTYKLAPHDIASSAWLRRSVPAICWFSRPLAGLCALAVHGIVFRASSWCCLQQKLKFFKSPAQFWLIHVLGFFFEICSDILVIMVLVNECINYDFIEPSSNLQPMV